MRAIHRNSDQRGQLPVALMIEYLILFDLGGDLDWETPRPVHAGGKFG
jgi:hypothetical protein